MLNSGVVVLTESSPVALTRNFTNKFFNILTLGCQMQADTAFIKGFVKPSKRLQIFDKLYSPFHRVGIVAERLAIRGNCLIFPL